MKDSGTTGSGFQPRWVVSSSPHIRARDDTSRIMLSVILALLPASIWGVYLFGPPALLTLTLSVAFCLAFEAASQKLLGKPVTLWDLSAAVTGVLLAMNLPPTSPWWLIAAGAFVAMFFGKHVYGGLGHNIFNPALVGRVFLLISFPAQMTSWAVPRPPFGTGHIDAITSATVLGEIKTSLMVTGKIGYISTPVWDLVIGNTGGSRGEMSALLLLVGAAFLLARRIISWHTRVAFVGTVLVMATVGHLFYPDKVAHPLIHLFGGGLILGAFFMATDYVTTPITPLGKLVFGIGCGFITFVIRQFGGYPEGVSFAILLMNATTPLIDSYIRPRVFGTGKAKP
ncbi:MAG TPA: RnfABCDGE type electron transport complex subunit D [Proteobacteria bacterium]|nr:RnfABCDGE type electron transport complex subunit D [Pseudomonadota bacterium]